VKTAESNFAVRLALWLDYALSTTNPLPASTFIQTAIFIALDAASMEMLST
jgi:hypothetical protein